MLTFASQAHDVPFTIHKSHSKTLHFTQPGLKHRHCSRLVPGSRHRNESSTSTSPCYNQCKRISRTKSSRGRPSPLFVLSTLKPDRNYVRMTDRHKGCTARSQTAQSRRHLHYLSFLFVVVPDVVTVLLACRLCPCASSACVATSSMELKGVLACCRAARVCSCNYLHACTLGFA